MFCFSHTLYSEGLASHAIFTFWHHKTRASYKGHMTSDCCHFNCRCCCFCPIAFYFLRTLLSSYVINFVHFSWNSLEILPTCQVVVGPPAELACLAGELILNKLVVLAGSADPAAAHLTLPDHLHTTQPRQQRWWAESCRHFAVCLKCWSSQDKKRTTAFKNIWITD